MLAHPGIQELLPRKIHCLQNSGTERCRLLRDSRWRHNPPGNLKQDIEKVGTACATALIRTSFPPVERVFSIQPRTLFHNRSFKYLKAPLLDRPTSEGIPRYFSLSDSCWTRRIFLTSYLVVLGQPLLKNTEDLLILTCCPDATQYLPSSNFASAAPSKLTLINNGLSSAKSR